MITMKRYIEQLQENCKLYDEYIAFKSSANGLYKHESIAKLFEYFNEITSKLAKISDPSTVKVSSLI